METQTSAEGNVIEMVAVPPQSNTYRLAKYAGIAALAAATYIAGVATGYAKRDDITKARNIAYLVAHPEALGAITKGVLNGTYKGMMEAGRQVQAERKVKE